ncbi:MAG: dihydrodipicolinate synthase family protein [Pirellulales bacterium]|nr:dihydrodipicolinate synthase family protein [Pirellulales bacterium]
MRTSIIAAICTPLNDNDSLHIEGLAAHLDDQWRHGFAGVLVGGTMGLMQLLDEETYRDLVRHAARLAKGRGEIMVGAGDASLVRTLRRIEYVEQFDVDAIVVLPPFFHPLGQADLIRYYRHLADSSRKPLYLYDLPQVTKTKLELETVLQLTRHPNIRGIKSSGEWTWTRHLMDRVGDRFRVIPAQPELVDLLIRCGVRDNLDGIFSVVPDLTARLIGAAELGEWEQAAARQRDLTELLNLVRFQYPLFPACSALLNARGVAGRVFPAPMEPLPPQIVEQLLAEPPIRRIMQPTPVEG